MPSLTIGPPVIDKVDGVVPKLVEVSPIGIRILAVLAPSVLPESPYKISGYLLGTNVDCTPNHRADHAPMILPEK